MQVDRVILMGLMENYHRLAAAGERLAEEILQNKVDVQDAYRASRQLASFASYVAEALDRAEQWGYAKHITQLEHLFRQSKK